MKDEYQTSKITASKTRSITINKFRILNFEYFIENKNTNNSNISNQEFHFNDIPAEIIYYICTFMALPEIRGCSLVSKNFRQGIIYAPHEHHVEIKNDGKTLKALSGGIRFTSVHFSCDTGKFSNEARKIVSKMIWIKSLAFSERLPDISVLKGYKNLVSLDLSHNHITHLDAAAIAANPSFTKLEKLRLGNNKIGNIGAKAIAESKILNKLKTLELEKNGIEDNGAITIGKSIHLVNLTFLNLAYNNICDMGAKVIAENPLFITLEKLNLGNNRIGNVGARSIATCPHFANLESINLEYNNIHQAELRYIAASPFLPNIQEINL